MCPRDAFARGFINTNNKATLNIYHSYGDKPLSDVKFSIYHIADITEQVQFNVKDTFKQYPINFDAIYDSTEWYILADTLANYIKIDSIPATNTITTNSEGKATLSDLKVGLYLGVAEEVSINNKTIQTKPFLVSLPNIDERNDIWTYNITVNTKTDEDINENINLFVEKIWENKEADIAAPSSIIVGLYCNGKQYDTVVLSEENDWKHSWINLNKDLEWTIKEIEVPPNYTVSYEVYRSNITITNTYENEKTDTEDEEDEENTENDESKLPTTGQLIGSSITVALAVILIILGFILIKDRKKDNTK